MRILVNDKPRDVTAKRLSFSQIVLMGLYDIPVFDRADPTVEYSYKDGAVKCAGLMAARSSMDIRPEMVFVVTNGKRKGAAAVGEKKDFPIPIDPNKPSTDPPRVWSKEGAIEKRRAELAAEGRKLKIEPDLTQEEIERICPTIAALPDDGFKQLWAKKEREYQIKNNIIFQRKQQAMKHYQFSYKLPAVQNGGLGPIATHEFKFIQIAAENMWQAIEKVKKIYDNYEEIFDLSNISEMP